MVCFSGIGRRDMVEVEDGDEVGEAEAGMTFLFHSVI
jgi:hypothetical protein